MTWTRRLKRNFGWLLGPPIGLVALQSGEAIGQITLAALGVDAGSGAFVASFAPARKSAPPFHATSALSILTRNPFDSETGPLGRVRSTPAGEAPDDPTSVPACERLKVSAIAASADPDFSLAVFTDGTDARALIRRRSGEVGNLKVEQIGWDRVWMSGPRGLCQAVMFAESPDPPRAADAGVAHDTVPTVPAWISGGIETISPTEHAIDRALVPRILEGRADLLRGVRVAPELTGGKIAGARLTGVPPESLLAKLGLMSGDRLDTINGYELTSTEAAVEAYARLQSADRLVLQVNRGGSEVRLQLDIR
jgi:general secretion pathway protein C